MFKITSSGTHTVLHSFNNTNGRYPYAGLVQGSDGNFYGTTQSGAASDRGTVFKMTASGTHTVLHSFDGSSAASPQCTPTFGTDGNLYGTAEAMAVWRLNFDTTTQTPTLVAPAPSSSTSSPISVSFTLPEAALAGSVKLAFGATELTLAASQESAGAHSFSFNPANPTASPEIASGSAIADGSYTVTLSYQDALGNPAAQTQSNGVVVDTVTSDPLFFAPAAITKYGANVPVSFQLPEAAQSGSVKLSFGSEVLTLASSHETAGNHDFNFPVSNPTASADIASGSAIADGVYSVTLSYNDALGNPTASVLHSAVEIDAVPNDPVFTTLHSKGGAVPDAGVSGSGIPAGAIWSKLGIPSINDAGHLAVLGDWAAGTVRGSSIFRGGPGAVNLQISLSKGAAVPGLTNVVLGTLKDPILGPDGSIAVVAGLANAPSTTGAVTTADNAALVLDADGSGAGGAVVIARKGTAAPGAGGALWKTFDSVAVGNNAVAILGKLSGAGIGTGNDQCLWIYNRNTMTTTLALREGNTLMGSTVKVIGALVARAAAGAQGRGVANDGTQDQVAVRVTLANGAQAVGAVDENGTFGVSYQTGGVAPDYVNATWKSIGLPGQNTVSAQAFVGVVNDVISDGNTAIFTEDDSTFTLRQRLTKGSTAAGILGGSFAGFKDPVNGTGGTFVFVGSVAANSSAGISSTNNDGVWYHDGSFTIGSPLASYSLIAREGSQPPGTTTGTQWKAFTSVALPNGRKPLFYATLVVGPGGVTTASDTGIWAVDSLGQVKKLIQEGDAFGSSTVKSFKALLPLTGSPAQTRSFNNNGEVVMQVTDAAGGTHLLHVAVP
ncbi:MAG: hypothetical protein JNJ83_24645 [Verrucomicrobiaceae bacterium]|nr:hypothetical protein [Verrucomicrobiaceae bacterium]